jgi:SM-20-related protein
VSGELALNPALDLAPYRESFGRTKRVRITDILTQESAERIHDCLAEQVPWRLNYRHRGVDQLLTQEAFAALPPERRAAIEREIYADAGFGFQYLYYAYKLDEEFRQSNAPPQLLHEVMDFLNTPVFLSFVRSVTGIETITRANGQATCYSRGHFLTVHTDIVPAEERLAAYVLSFTKNWNPNWGGILEFYDPAGNVIEGLLPLFNAISIFEVPQPHAVTYVAPYAMWPRFSITGWFKP